MDRRHIDEAFELLKTLSVQLAGEAKIFEGIDDLLASLQAKDLHLSLWTGRDLASTSVILKQTGLERFFPTLVSGCCVQRKKPDPEGIHQVLAKAGFESNSSVMVGDHPYDIEAANAAGVKTISVDWTESAHHSFASLSQFHFSRVADLKQWAKTNRP